MRIRVAGSAKEDLRRSARFYENQSLGHGRKFAACFRKTTARLQFSGGMHEKVEGLFRFLMPPYPYAIFYIRGDGEFVVLAIIDCRGHPEAIDRRLRQAKREFETE